MDDVDAAQAQIARNMLRSGDWVTARMDGIIYLEKAPAKYWMIAVSFAIFGVHDWAARIPVALSTILLCWVVVRIGAWAFSPRVGYYSGLALATCIGLFLFTRILIPDVILTLAITVALWAFARALDEEEHRPRLWAWLMWASLAAGVLLKGLIGVVFPAGAAFIYLLLTRQLPCRHTWRRLHPFTGIAMFLVLALPWHVLATLRNPPYVDLTLGSEPHFGGRFRGFFWFYFINEHLLRFLNERWPRDYNTVPRLWFWLFHLIWLFPWSVFLPALARLGYRPVDRAGRMRVLALCWIGVVMLFFSFSTTQEYYSMPIYPALALLLGGAMALEARWVRLAPKIAGAIAAAAALAAFGILYSVRGMPAPGDISAALSQNPDVYTLSLGHMTDLTLRSFAYLRAPLALAGLGFALGAAGAFLFARERAYIALAVMMLLLFQAARLAMVAFDPYMSSRPLAEALKRAPEGRLILGDQYYLFSSVFFYTDYRTLILNGRVNNLEYGSYAPGAPDVFIDNGDLERLWRAPQRAYLLAEANEMPRLEALVGAQNLHMVAESGGKLLFANQAVSASASLARGGAPALAAHAHPH